MTHKLLQRQLKRLLGIQDDAQLTDVLAEFAALAQREQVSEAAQRGLREIGTLLKQVDAAYVQNERSLELSTRSLELSSSELGQANEALRAEATARERALQTLRDTANQLLEPLGKHIGEDDQSLGRLTELLSGLVRDLMDAQRHAEAAVAKLRNQQFALDQHAIVSITNPEGQIIYANEKFCEISKFKREQLLGQDHRIINSGVHGKAFFREMWDTIRAGKVWHGEVCNLDSVGGKYWVAATVVPFLDAQGQPYEYISMRTDISERKQAEEELRRSDLKQRMLLDNAADAVFVVNQERRMVYVNELALTLLGYTREELVGKAFFDLLPAEFVERYLAHMRAGLMDTGRMHAESVFTNKFGESIPVELNVAVLPDRNFYISCRDITLRKEVEATLMRAKEAAEANSRAKSDFLATMSHEIRTPMNGIIGMTELTLETQLDAEQREYLGLVKTSADHLLAIINDILDFSKIESGKMVLERIEFDLPMLVATTTKLLAVQAQAKGLTLTFDIADGIPDSLLGDPGRLRQVLVNLIGNAIKFTDQGEISVHIKQTRRDHQQIRLACKVQDQGIGISPEKQASIFEAFTQADTSTTRKYGGTGLGLAICSQLVAAMGGTLGVSSEVGQGSTFYFEADFTVTTPSQASKSDGELAGVSVLIVDDNATNLRLLSQMVKRWGMIPTLVASADEAIACVQRATHDACPFSLVILDAMMPRMDGFDLALRLRGVPQMSGSIMMMLSSAGMRGDAQRCRDLGIQAYLTKPVEPEDLHIAIHTALKASPDSVLITRHNLKQVRPARHLHILLAEDNPVNQKLALTLLSKWGHKVDLAVNGQQAVDMSALSRYDIILMDWQMPVMGGLEATQWIRQREGEGPDRVPIVAMTANAMSGDRERCLQAGMDHYISKPLNVEELRQVLDKMAGPGSTILNDKPPAPAQVSADFDYAQALRQSDEWIVETIGQAFLDECPTLMTDILVAIESGNASDLSRHAHTLRGLVGNFQARPVEETSLALEASGREGHMNKAAEKYALLKVQMKQLTNALATALAGLGASGK